MLPRQVLLLLLLPLPPAVAATAAAAAPFQTQPGSRPSFNPTSLAPASPVRRTPDRCLHIHRRRTGCYTSIPHQSPHASQQVMGVHKQTPKVAQGSPSPRRNPSRRLRHSTPPTEASRATRSKLTAQHLLRGDRDGRGEAQAISTPQAGDDVPRPQEESVTAAVTAHGTPETSWQRRSSLIGHDARSEHLKQQKPLASKTKSEASTSPAWDSPLMTYYNWVAVMSYAAASDSPDGIDVNWLLHTARSCTLLAEPALDVLYRCPPLTNDHKARSLVALLARPPSRTFYNYRAKIRALRIDTAFVTIKLILQVRFANFQVPSWNMRVTKQDESDDAIAAREARTKSSPVLGTACPDLRELRMNLQYFRHYDAFDDSNPLYETLLYPDQIPTWPAALQRIELDNLRQWTVEAATNFFQSLIDSAAQLPMLRYLVVRCMLNIPWKSRSEFRHVWEPKLNTIFLRPKLSPPPVSSKDTNMRSKSTPPKKPRKGKKASTDRPARQSRRIASKTSGQSSRASSASKPLRSIKRKQYEEPDSDEFDHEDDLDVDMDSSETEASEAGSNEGNSPAGASDGIFVQGLCTVVEIKLDNQKPREQQFVMEDFVDSERGDTDPEWDSQDDDFE
ncbi:conserved hypothetical protein [Verticillium alfalfae VaMs.102]|uniref:Uncharacterized protein n=1 Tax=Verticillium alfalfae (strain VaMs.102 / ATCC MYA-4576 / FGSC 10136) TaxID=526221 RepID=C9SE43_VERA1|nr:conserved hypothetical protein [Verticillium alfalfae VaMs.102]EEY17290.1 conserved hypothetical protein [Verticillium alfalfae VaMs.102]